MNFNNNSIWYLTILFVGAVIASPTNDLGRIVNGEHADLQPYHVRVIARQNVNSLRIGAGTLITKRHVLTLRSLVTMYSDWIIGYGGDSLNNLKNITSVVGFMHPVSDLGVIMLPSNILSPLLAPINLPDVIEPLPRTYEEGTVVGFETSAHNTQPAFNAPLKSAYLLVHPNNECTVRTNETFCASNSYYSANVCGTDIGSGFAIHHRGQIILAGILISASNNCAQNTKSHYHRIQSYVNWIKTVTTP